MNANVNLQKRVLIAAAKIVQKFGDAYLPILDRAEHEYESALAAANAQSRANQILARLHAR